MKGFSPICVIALTIFRFCTFPTITNMRTEMLTFNVRIVANSEEIRFNNVSEETSNLLEKISRLAGFEACFSADIKKPVLIERDGGNSLTLRRSNAIITEKTDITEVCPSGEESPKGNHSCSCGGTWCAGDDSCIYQKGGDNVG